VATAATGAAAGGALGEDLRQVATEHFHPEDKKMTPGEALRGMGKEAAGQAAGEATGQTLGRWFRPTLENTINKLWFAADLGPKTDLDAVMPEILREEKGAPAKTVGDFVKVVSGAKDKIGNEVDTAMRHTVNVPGVRNPVPLAAAPANTTPIANRIMQLTASHPSQMITDPEKIAAIRNRATGLYSQPRSYGWLNDRRIVLNDELNRFYSLKTPAEQGLYLSQHPEFEIDKAEADAIRELIYPQMDRAAGKPAGYFESLQRKRGALKSIEKQTQTHLNDLTAKTRKAKGAPINDPAHAYASGSGHVGIYTRLTNLRAPDVAKRADKQVARAFSHTPGAKVGGILGTRPGMEVMGLPIRELFTPEQ
jgi:hypothetical protein